MVARVLMLIYRKSDLTPEEFFHRYEDVHMPLTKELTGDTFPLSHTRRYIPRPAGPPDSPLGTGEFPAVVLGGNSEDVEIDCITELIFRDKEHMQSYFVLPDAPGAAARLEKEAENYVEKYQTILIEDCAETLPDPRPESRPKSGSESRPVSKVWSLKGALLRWRR